MNVIETFTTQENPSTGVEIGERSAERPTRPRSVRAHRCEQDGHVSVSLLSQGIHPRVHPSFMHLPQALTGLAIVVPECVT